jgi:hypothetical protein
MQIRIFTQGYHCCSERDAKTAASTSWVVLDHLDKRDLVNAVVEAEFENDQGAIRRFRCRDRPQSHCCGI